MKEEDFIKKVLKWGGTTISAHSIESCGEYQRIAELTNYIRYDCGIVSGKISCKGGKNISRGCCCDRCAGTLGYRKSISQEEIPLLAEHFDGKTGYWRSGKGCILPRKHRSITCLTHRCYRVGILSHLVLNVIQSAKSDGCWIPVLCYCQSDWDGFVKLLKKENKYKEPVKE